MRVRRFARLEYKERRRGAATESCRPQRWKTKRLHVWRDFGRGGCDAHVRKSQRRVSGCDRGCDACVNFGEETRESTGRLCRPRAKGKQLLICSPLTLLCWDQSLQDAAYRSRIFRTRNYRLWAHLLGAITRFGQSLAIIADWTRSSGSRYLGIGAVEKVAPSIFDRIKWQFNGTTDATIANRNGPELNEILLVLKLD